MVSLLSIEFAIEEVVSFIIAGGLAGVVWWFAGLQFIGVPCGIFPLFCGASLYFFIVLWGMVGLVVGPMVIYLGKSDEELL